MHLGRNKDKLSDLKRSIIDKFGEKFNTLPLIIANTRNELAMQKLCLQTKLLLNCVGPFRFVWFWITTAQ